MSKRKSKTRGKRASTEAFKIVVEKHADGCVAYPLGLKGALLPNVISSPNSPSHRSDGPFQIAKPQFSNKAAKRRGSRPG
jgi:hypothetical protein